MLHPGIIRGQQRRERKDWGKTAKKKGGRYAHPTSVARESRLYGASPLSATTAQKFGLVVGVVLELELWCSLVLLPTGVSDFALVFALCSFD